MPKYFLDVFENYRYNYQRIFSILYPSKNSTGFTERNLSVNCYLTSRIRIFDMQNTK